MKSTAIADHLSSCVACNSFSATRPLLLTAPSYTSCSFSACPPPSGCYLHPPATRLPWIQLADKIMEVAIPSVTSDGPSAQCRSQAPVSRELRVQEPHPCPSNPELSWPLPHPHCTETPHPPYDGTISTLVTVLASVSHPAPRRETPRSVTSGIDRYWPTLKSPFLCS